MSALPPKADMCGALGDVRFVPIADIGPSAPLGFLPSLIQELLTGSAGAFFEARMPSADKINFVKTDRLPVTERRKIARSSIGDIMVNRRTLLGAAAASAALILLNRVASAQTLPKTRNVVFVHGLFADGSCWSKVIARLQQKGVNCTSMQIR